jgi:hypothetical protein
VLEAGFGGPVGTVAASLPSPAVGTAIEQWPELLQVDVTCYQWLGWPAGPGGAVRGVPFLPLRGDYEPAFARSGVREWTIGVSPFSFREPDPARQERAEWPSRLVRQENTVDVEVSRPLPENAGYVTVTATLRR